MRWRNGVGHSLAWCILFFTCAGLCVNKARQFARLAPSQRTTLSKYLDDRYYPLRGLALRSYTCYYSFSVNGELYSGHGDCPQAGGVRAGSSATVYYDPNDPSVNSLIEFSAASARYYGYKVPWIVFGTFCILIMVFAAKLAAIKKSGRGRMVVDAHGTVLDPEEIGTGADYGGLPGNGRMAGEQSAADPGSSASPDLRSLYLETVNRIHPDRASSEEDRTVRERLMKEANAAFERGDAATLRRVLEEYRSTAKSA
jgi:hypothetical protein